MIRENAARERNVGRVKHDVPTKRCSASPQRNTCTKHTRSEPRAFKPLGPEQPVSLVFFSMGVSIDPIVLNLL